MQGTQGEGVERDGELVPGAVRREEMEMETEMMEEGRAEGGEGEGTVEARMR